MRVCIGLITCGRDDFTWETVESFLEHNDPERFLLVHAPEAGDNDAIVEWVRSRGFTTLPRPRQRQGQMAACIAVCDAAEKAGCSHTVIQENDWPWCAEFPWWVFKTGLDFDTLRLFGAMKHRGGPRAPTGTRSLATGRALEWKPADDGLEWAWAHYVPLAATRTACLAPWMRHFAGQGMKAMCKDRDIMALRLTSNVVWSIGEATTEGFKV